VLSVLSEHTIKRFRVTASAPQSYNGLNHYYCKSCIDCNDFNFQIHTFFSKTGFFCKSFTAKDLVLIELHQKYITAEMVTYRQM